jgi:hypothetical protein
VQEVCFAKIVLLNIGGGKAYTAVFGKDPVLWQDDETPNTVQREDEIALGKARVREIALASKCSGDSTVVHTTIFDVTDANEWRIT